MLKDKIYTHIYKCKKCNKTLYYLSNEEYSTVCKTCGQDLIFEMSRPYNPKNNIRQANSMNSRSRATTQKQTQSINEYIPKCPTCGSTDLRKINIAERGVSIFTFGLLSKKINKTFECENCGYTW